MKTSRMLADTSELLLKRYDGDLRKLREVAEREPAREKELLMECKDIGPVGADIFLREVQVAWMELQRSRRRENPRAGALAAWKCSSKRCVRVSRIRFATRSPLKWRKYS